jgi:hypothetical protein
MAIFGRKIPKHHLVQIHKDNATSTDWIVLLEASTIVGPSPDRLRIARTTQERKIVQRRTGLFGKKHFLVVDGYDPRIHAVYFCPQLFSYNTEKQLVPLEGEAIGRLIARALESGIKDRRPWYEPSEELPDQPIVATTMGPEFDTLVVETVESPPLALAAQR